MSEFDDFMAEGAATSMDTIGRVTVRRGTVVVGGVVGSVHSQRRLQDAGVWSDADVALEVERADFVLLGIADRTTIEIEALAKTIGRFFYVAGIDPDPHDPCVLLALKLQKSQS
jgi:hypothetical protein